MGPAVIVVEWGVIRLGEARRTRRMSLRWCLFRGTQNLSESAAPNAPLVSTACGIKAYPFTWIQRIHVQASRWREKQPREPLTVDFESIQRSTDSEPRETDGKPWKSSKNKWRTRETQRLSKIRRRFSLWRLPAIHLGSAERHLDQCPVFWFRDMSWHWET